MHEDISKGHLTPNVCVYILGAYIFLIYFKQAQTFDTSTTACEKKKKKVLRGLILIFLSIFYCIIF